MFAWNFKGSIHSISSPSLKEWCFTDHSFSLPPFLRGEGVEWVDNVQLGRRVRLVGWDQTDSFTPDTNIDFHRAATVRASDWIGSYKQLQSSVLINNCRTKSLYSDIIRQALALICFLVLNCTESPLAQISSDLRPKTNWLLRNNSQRQWRKNVLKASGNDSVRWWLPAVILCSHSGSWKLVPPLGTC